VCIIRAIQTPLQRQSPQERGLFYLDRILGASKVGGHAISDATSVKRVSNRMDSGKAGRYLKSRTRLAGSHMTNIQSRNDVQLTESRSVSCGD